ncbi:MAG TPA: sorbosone dehydrogenase family protein [Terrimicrobiaceae bacterium]|nr:sorbosone dehydrogenase family protein [Terrimicrobiaceae bacterium]
MPAKRDGLVAYRTVAVAATIVLGASSIGQSEVLKGQGKAGDWQSDAPGVRHQITMADLPPDLATPSASNGPRVVPAPKNAKPRVPKGFEVALFATGLINPRYLLTAPNGDIFVTESSANTIRVLRDSDGDGRPDINEKFATGLSQPFGLAFYPPGPDPMFLYVANTDGIVRFPYRNGDLRARGKPERIADLSSGGRLTGGGHWTRDIVFSADGTKLYASVGSKTNVSDEAAEPAERERARIFQFEPDGSNRTTYAWGIRNAVGIAIQPETGDLWASVNERDGLGDDLVPDYVTRVLKGGFYGWPWYYLGNHQDPRHKGSRPDLAAKVLEPDVLIQAHSAPLNLIFYEGEQFPADFKGDAFVALHGSWNRSKRTGYKVVRIPLENGKPRGVYDDFLTGFVTPEGDVWGRPVGLTVAKDGSLLVSEDGNNAIWRIAYRK